MLRRIQFHPRVCGEHRCRPPCYSRSAGSSPRLRGTPGGWRGDILRRRFIPASAGNTGPPTAPYRTFSVHPRVCGEHFSTTHARPRICGSSPRLRGTHPPELNVLVTHRFIPASAGNTIIQKVLKDKPTVHPRVCGEHFKMRPIVFWLIGSSPRLRGTRAKIRRAGIHRRFIPASAGNTGAEPLRRIPAAVHPRVCGEHHVWQTANSPMYGSSPRLRGTLRQVLGHHAITRFIPASAGNTVFSYEIWETPSVHPRVCGEHVMSLYRSF